MGFQNQSVSCTCDLEEQRPYPGCLSSWTIWKLWQNTVNTQKAATLRIKIMAKTIFLPDLFFLTGHAFCILACHRISFLPQSMKIPHEVSIFLDLTHDDSHTYRTSQRWFHLDDQNEPHIQGTYGACRNIHPFSVLPTLLKFIFVLLHFMQWHPHSMGFCLYILYISTMKKMLFKFHVLNFAVKNQRLFYHVQSYLYDIIICDLLKHV